MLGGKELDEKLRNCSPQWLKYENMEQCGSLKVSPELTEYVDSFKELTTVVLSWGDWVPHPSPGDIWHCLETVLGFHSWEEGATGISGIERNQGCC